MIGAWSDKKYCTKRELQSFVGHLLHIHKCMQPARYFLNSMLDILHHVSNPNRIGICIGSRNFFLTTMRCLYTVICTMIDAWSDKKYCTKRELQSFVGHLLHIHKCMQPARYFLNSMLDILHHVSNPNRIGICIGSRNFFLTTMRCLYTVIRKCTIY